MPTTIIRCLLLSLAAVDSSGNAASEYEQGELSLVQQQLVIIERLAAQAETSGSAQPNERYRLDYPRLADDIRRIRQGVQGYLFPSRAQPRDSTELVGDYRLDTPPTEPSP
ncbi:integrative conjugative element protein, RAQPRD family [Pseudomonas canadensis]|uniref:RAQPRD family integrative conjugative element protein n=1 Tax=Pseudomonas canadensis TaxID=915099 RepID=A0ABZ0ZYJ5_9PSED|nr:RAQPRD family integrative conjugative element protein [Pseudomonas canadensis]WRI21872.1 RAQPRD family integrative conjugative element protein [Pseudomonas canadensis]